MPSRYSKYQSPAEPSPVSEHYNWQPFTTDIDGIFTNNSTEWIVIIGLQDVVSPTASIEISLRDPSGNSKQSVILYAGNPPPIVSFPRILIAPNWFIVYTNNGTLTSTNFVAVQCDSLDSALMIL